MNIKFLLRHMVRKQWFLVLVLIISLSVNCVVIIKNNNHHMNNMVDRLDGSIQNIFNSNYDKLVRGLNQQIDPIKDICKLKNAEQKNDSVTLNCEGLDNRYIALSIQSAFYNSQPFDGWLTHIQVTEDDYLSKIAKTGVPTTQALQQEFIYKILPLIAASNQIYIDNNLLAKWVKLRHYDQYTEEQLNMLHQQVSTQDFNNAIQIVATLPQDVQKIIQPWQEKVKAYIYAKESLKMYLEQHD